MLHKINAPFPFENAEYLEELMKACGTGGRCCRYMLQLLDRQYLQRAEDALALSEFTDPPEIQAFTAKSFVLLTNRVLILTSC